MNRYGRLLRCAALAGSAAAVLAGCGMPPMTAGMSAFRGAMSAGNEVPPNGSTGSGVAEAWLDKGSNLLKWRVTYSGLTGPATMAHFHGPALPGANAGVTLPFANPASPIEGQAVLTPAQAADLVAGKWYANIHTAAFPAGEIRGQLVPAL